MKKQEWFLLLLVIFVLIYYHNNKTNDITIVPEPTPVVPVIPEPTPNPVPEVIKNPYEKALEKAVKSNKKLLVLFTADWCGYCRSLKKDLPNMDTSNYELCELNVDKKNNKDYRDKFNVKMIPCSIIIDPKLDKEIKRKCGYQSEEYRTWLKE